MIDDKQFWVLENTSPILCSVQDIITKLPGCDAVIIDISYLSAQH
jgi:hypothetical protein